MMAVTDSKDYGASPDREEGRDQPHILTLMSPRIEGQTSSTETSSMHSYSCS